MAKLKSNIPESENKKAGIVSGIVGMGVILLLAVFPLFYHHYYFDILITKYKFYYITVIGMAILAGVALIIIRPKVKTKGIWNGADLALVVLLLVYIISTLQSDYIYESFWGNEGRYNGLFLWLLYGMSFFVIGKMLNFKNWYLDIFLIAGMLVCLFGITDYFRMDLLGFKQNISPTQYNMFTSTIGNINTYTAYVALVMGVASVLFAMSRSKIRMICYYICMIISFLAIVMGLSDNSYLSLGALFGFLPLCLFQSKTGIKRYLVMLTSFVGVIYAVDCINKIAPDAVLQTDGILQKLSGFNGLEYALLLMIVFCIVIYILDGRGKFPKEQLGKTPRMMWLAFIGIVILGVLYILYDANIAGNAERYGSLENYLVLNDDWGTNRGYNWRIGMENFMQFSPIRKLFGHGPDTYGILTHYNNYSDMVNRYNEYFENAHNEYLQYLVTTGILGLIAYISFLISTGVILWKKGKQNPYVIGVLFALICYAVQAVVNINLPISTPVLITLMAVGMAGCRADELS